MQALLHTFLTLALDGDEWSALHHWGFTPGTHFTVGWVGPGAGVDILERRKITCPCRELKCDASVIQTIA